MEADEYIEFLGLEAHPEGGYYRETWRSNRTVEMGGFDGARSLCTSIYFLLKAGQESALHRIKSDEIWYFHAGDGLLLVEMQANGAEVVTPIGPDFRSGQVLQHVVKAGRWFGARLPEGAKFCLVGCQVSPGFDFRDFELK